MVDVRRVGLEETLALKQRVLRPHQTIEELAQENAGLPDLACFAVVEGERVIGTATVHREAAPWAPHETPAWRLRSMATEEGRRGQGIGTALLTALIARCEAGPWRQMIAVIGDSGNAGSIAVHRNAGFALIGTLPETSVPVVTAPKPFIEKTRSTGSRKCREESFSATCRAARSSSSRN